MLSHQRCSVVFGTSLVAAALAMATIAPTPALAATNSTPCGPLWSDSSSDAPVTPVGQQDQLDIVSGGIADNSSAVQTTLTLKNLSTTVPAGATANEYYLVFSVG